jgi:hypothetical protein
MRSIMRKLGVQASQSIITAMSTFCGPAAELCVAAGNYDLARAHGADQSGAMKVAAIAGIEADVKGNDDTCSGDDNEDLIFNVVGDNEKSNANTDNPSQDMIEAMLEQIRKESWNGNKPFSVHNLPTVPNLVGNSFHGASPRKFRVLSKWFFYY